MTLICCVPFCKKTTERTDYDEWVCGDHWKGIPKQRRQVYTRAKRRAISSGSPEDRDAAGLLWARMKAKAIERAAGI